MEYRQSVSDEAVTHKYCRHHRRRGVEEALQESQALTAPANESVSQNGYLDAYHEATGGTAATILAPACQVSSPTEGRGLEIPPRVMASDHPSAGDGGSSWKAHGEAQQQIEYYPQESIPQSSDLTQPVGQQWPSFAEAHEDVGQVGGYDDNRVTELTGHDSPEAYENTGYAGREEVEGVAPVRWEADIAHHDQRPGRW